MRIPRRHDDFDRWPAVSHGSREAETIHGPGHVDIGEDNPDVVRDFEDCDGLVGVARLEDVEARIFDDVEGVQPQQRLVLDDEDDGAGRRDARAHDRRPITVQ